MQKWEYASVYEGDINMYVKFYNIGACIREDIKRDEFGKRVAALGEEGWKLVSVSNYTWYFKRPKP